MVCVYCNSETNVTNSRPQRRTNSVWRRRYCATCQAIFSTLEHVDYEKSWVVQYKSGKLSPFLRDKLLLSLYKSCQHRPSVLEDAIGLTTTVIAASTPQTRNGSLSVEILASVSHQTLTRFDQAAATYYQAYHSDVL